MVRKRPGARAQASGCVTGGGCGITVLLLAVVPVGLVWLVLRWVGVGVPSVGAVLDGPPGGSGWLVLSTVVSLLVLAVGLALVVTMFLTDQVPQPLPRRVYLAWLLPVLPAVDLLAVVAAWICFALDQPGPARSLGLVPWLVGPVLAVTAALVSSGLAAHER